KAPWKRARADWLPRSVARRDEWSEGGQGGDLLVFADKTALHEGAELLQSQLGVVSFRGDLDDRALGRREHHEAHDALAVDFFAVLLHPDVTGKAIGELDELRGGTGMETVFVRDSQFAGGHWR